MNLAFAKIEAQKILQSERKKTFFVSLLSIVFTLTMLSAAVFGIYCINMLGSYDKISGNIIMLISFYALFSLEVIISIFILSVISFNKKRWFFENAYHKNNIRRFFASEPFKVRLKSFYFFVFKKVMNIVLFILYEIPFITVIGAIIYYTQNSGIYRRIFILSLIFSAVLFFTGLYFALASMQKYYFCELLLYCNKDLSVINAIKKSKSLTDSSRFRLINYKLSFCLWTLSCILILPAFYALPYINQSFGAVGLKYLEKFNPLSAKDIPIIFMTSAESKA